MDSIYPVSQLSRREVASGSGVGGDRLTFLLNKDQIMQEHSVTLIFSQVFTGTPTSVVADRVGALLKNVKLSVSGPQAGDWVNMPGISLKLYNRLFDESLSIVTVLGATTVITVMFDLEYINDRAHRDLITAVNGLNATQIKLDIDIASSSSGVIIGGTGPGAITANVSVVSQGYDPAELVAAVDSVYPDSPLANSISTGKHFRRVFSPASSSAGTLQVDLDVGNKTRGILVEVETPGGVFSDSLVTSASLVISGVQKYVTPWQHMRNSTANELALDAVGVVYLNFGDDELGWLDLLEVKQARISFDTSGAVNMRVTQDYTTVG